MIQVQYIKSASVILEKTSGHVLLCKRNSNLKAFPDQWVFPGGKIDEKLSENWIGDELEVEDTVLREMYEEIGILPGTNYTIPVNQRNRNWMSIDYNDKERKEFLDAMQFIGRKKTPSFMPKSFDTAYFYIKHELVDRIEAIVDGSELVDMMWVRPSEAIELWNKTEIRLPPPTLHLLRTMKDDYNNLILRTMIETELPIGLQTRVEFASGIVAIPIISNTIKPFISTNLILINSDDRYLIIDPGAADKKHLTTVLESISQPDAVIITHHHKDHWEGLTEIERLYPKTLVYAHKKHIDLISTTLTKQIIPENIILGTKQLQIIPTPGHTDDHISILDTQTNVLIAGDHLVGYGSAVLDPECGDMSDYFATTDRLIELEPYLIIPAHGPVIYKSKNKLQEYKKHRKHRENTIYESILNGDNTLDKIVNTVYSDVPKEMWEYAKRNIQLHIDKLIKDGKINSF